MAKNPFGDMAETPAKPAPQQKVRSSKFVKVRSYPALEIVRVTLIVVACLVVLQWAIGLAMLVKYSVPRRVNAVKELATSIDGKEAFVVSPPPEYAATIDREEAFIAGVLGTISSAFVVTILIAFAELIKVMLDIQENTQRAAA